MSRGLNCLVAVSLGALFCAGCGGVWLLWQSLEESRRLELQNRELQASLEASRIKLENFCDYPTEALCPAEGLAPNVVSSVADTLMPMDAPALPEPAALSSSAFQAQAEVSVTAEAQSPSSELKVSSVSMPKENDRSEKPAGAAISDDMAKTRNLSVEASPLTEAPAIARSPAPGQTEPVATADNENSSLSPSVNAEVTPKFGRETRLPEERSINSAFKAAPSRLEAQAEARPAPAAPPSSIAQSADSNEEAEHSSDTAAPGVTAEASEDIMPASVSASVYEPVSASAKAVSLQAPAKAEPQGRTEVRGKLTFLEESAEEAIPAGTVERDARAAEYPVKSRSAEESITPAEAQPYLSTAPENSSISTPETAKPTAHDETLSPDRSDADVLPSPRIEETGITPASSEKTQDADKPDIAESTVKTTPQSSSSPATAPADCRKSWSRYEASGRTVTFWLAGEGDTIKASGALYTQPRRYVVTLEGHYKVAGHRPETSFVRGMDVSYTDTGTLLTFPLEGLARGCRVAYKDARTIVITLR